jgi:ribonuclease BN (tRNA processing enzyme)
MLRLNKGSDRLFRNRTRCVCHELRHGLFPFHQLWHRNLGLLPRLLVSVIALLLAANGWAQTKLVLLGTGTPIADPDRSGPAVAVVVNGTTYLVDCGPGVVRRAVAAERKNGIPALNAANLQKLFVTHLHSDHTLGLPDVIFTPWVMGRTAALEIYGPRGLQEMTDNIERAWVKDINIRVHGLEHANATGYKVQVHEVAPGVIYKDLNVTVTAIEVKHGSWDEALGYKFQTADRIIVMSGDTSPTDAVAKACDGCDVLLHEVYNPRPLSSETHPTLRYFQAFHTSAQELSTIANAAHPRLLVLYHQMFEGLPEQDLLDQLKQTYKGKVASARDLDVY